jgi:hypothetical protein
MSLQQERRRVSFAEEEAWSQCCAACSGRMRIVMATPSRREGGERIYACEYVCDCGYRQIFEKAP